MIAIKKSALVLFTPQQMFALVDRIEDYPHFLPGCQETTVHARGVETVEASICVAKGMFKHSFRTLNRFQGTQRIAIQLVDGPFRHLEGLWRFEEATGGGCHISFELEFEFKSKLISLTAGPVLEKIAGSFIDAFAERAKSLYG